MAHSAHETTTQMTDDERQRFKKRYQDLSVEQLEAVLNRLPPHAAEYRPVLREMIEEQRRVADAPMQKRHRELKRVQWIAATIALAGVAALWIQMCRPSQPAAAPASPPAVTRPSPTQAADVNDLDGGQKP